MNKPNILLTRIDNRLVHGQVGMSWVGKIRPKLIIVADDETANDKIQQSLLAMTAEMAGVGIRFFTIQKCIEVIFKALPEQTIFLVVKNPENVLKLINGGVPIKEVNIGNMHISEGKKVYKEPHVYVDDNDLNNFEKIKQSGAKLYIEIAPGDRRFDL